jgi:hypothetical protein
MLSISDAQAAFTHVSLLYNWLGEVPHENFLTFVSPTNYVAQLLMIHFFLAECAVGAITLGPIHSTSFSWRLKANAVWVDRLAARLPAEYTKYLQWPTTFIQSFE